jgi:hypothetical protein
MFQGSNRCYNNSKDSISRSWRLSPKKILNLNRQKEAWCYLQKDAFLEVVPKIMKKGSNVLEVVFLIIKKQSMIIAKSQFAVHHESSSGDQKEVGKKG